MLQKEVISPGKRYETSTGDPGRHLTTGIDRDQKVASRECMTMRWHLHSREQLAHIA